MVAKLIGRTVTIPNLLRRTAIKHGLRVTKFGLVGLTGVAVNYAVLLLMVGLVGFNPLVAAVIATEAAILSNFALNDFWTFSDLRQNGKRWSIRALRYNFFALGGLVISVLMLAALTYLLHMHYLLANLFAIGAATLWNYGANYCWTWTVVRPLEPTVWEEGND